MTDTEAPALADWLALREAADHAARAAATPRLLRHLGLHQPPQSVQPDQPVQRVVDVGAGTGSTLRHLAPQLAAAGTTSQDWLLLDQDADVLRRADQLLTAPLAVPPGTAVSAQTRLGDLADVGDLLAPGSLLTGSALLDVLRAHQVGSLVEALRRAQAPALLALTVTGRVDLDPPHPDDAALRAAFDAHQRRDGRLGPDAAGAAVQALADAGHEVLVLPSPWRLGPAEPELLVEWAAGRVEAAVEQDPSLAARADAWLDERRDQVARGALTAVVHHVDLAAAPR